MLPSAANPFSIEAANRFTQSKERLLLRVLSILRRELLALCKIGNQPLQPAAMAKDEDVQRSWRLEAVCKRDQVFICEHGEGMERICRRGSHGAVSPFFRRSATAKAMWE